MNHTNSPFSNSIVENFINKQVSVELEGLTVHGKLIRYDLGNKQKPHRPSILILECSTGKTIIRGNFVSITEVKSNA